LTNPLFQEGKIKATFMLLKATFATGFTGQQVAKKGPYQRGFRHKTD
jgi:hypothetical protein